MASDLDGTTCAEGICPNPANVLASITLRVDPAVGAVPDEEQLHLSIPLCIDHAHLTRMGVRLVSWSDGIG